MSQGRKSARAVRRTASNPLEFARLAQLMLLGPATGLDPATSAGSMATVLTRARRDITTSSRTFHFEFHRAGKIGKRDADSRKHRLNRRMAKWQIRK